MGVMVRISCKDCGVAWENLSTGSGVLHGTLESVAPYFLEDERKILLEYAKHSECPMFDFGFYPAVCKECGGFVSIPVVKLLEEDTTYTGVCPKCGKKLFPITDIEKVNCPVCKKCTLQIQNVGFWD